MCDEVTEAENDAFLARMKLNRREAGVAAFAAMLSGCASPREPAQAPEQTPLPPPRSTATPQPAPEASPPEPAQQAAPGTTSREVTIETPDGSAQGFFVAPSSGKHPGVLVWPDIAGLRQAFQTMATRLAGEGYAVLVVNQYYRSTKLPVLSTFSEWRTDAGRAKIMPMKDALTPEGIAKDGAAFAAWLDQQPEVDQKRKLATTGYCMGGPFTFRTAAAAPARVGVIGSFHGGGLVGNEASSPHKLLAKLKGAALICIAQNDDERAPQDKTTLREAAEKAHVPAEIEVYPAQHGWCVIDSPVYDEAQAERAWGRMLSTFQQHL